MRPDITELAVSSLAGSQSSVRVVADVWRGGHLLTDTGPLPLSSWQVGWDASRQVQGQAKVTVADPDGSLAPWDWDDPLAPGGSRLHLRYQMPQVGPTQEVSLGWFRIVQASPSEQWRFHPRAQRWVCTGGPVTVAAEDLTWQVKAERFLGPQAPVYTASVFAELRRLLDGIMPLGSTAGVTDARVPADLSYQQGRMDAVEDLITALGAVHRMSGHGLLDLLPATPGTPVWTIGPEEDDEQGVLVDVSRSLDASDAPNAAVVEGTSAAGDPIVGRAYEQYGPLAFGGPHGRIPAFLNSSVMDTQGKADAAARSFLVTTIGARRAVIRVTCLPHPGLQLHDVVAVKTPAGSLTGPVQSVQLAGSADGVLPMEVDVSVPAEQLTMIARELRRARD